MRVVVLTTPTTTRRSYRIINLEMCLGSGSLPSKLGLCIRAPMGVGFHTINNGRKGSGRRHLPKRPQCPPLPNPSPCDRTLGPRTPNQHLTKNTTSLWSAYLCSADTPIKTPDNLSTQNLTSPGRSVVRLLTSFPASPKWSLWDVSNNILTLGYRKVWQSSCKDKPPNGIHMRDWVNKYLVYQPIATMSYPTMVHRTVLPGIGPS